MSRGHILRKASIGVVVIQLVLGGCSEQPITMPEGLSEAANFCYFVNYHHFQRNDSRSENDLLPLGVYTKIQAYQMIVASKDPEFDDYALDRQMEGLSEYAIKQGPYIKSLSDAELEAEVSHCKDRFGLSNELAIPTLPEDEIDAAYHCLIASTFVTATLRSAKVDAEGRDQKIWIFHKSIENTAERLLSTNPSILGSTDLERESDGFDTMKQVFSQGDLSAYHSACMARFPAA